ARAAQIVHRHHLQPGVAAGIDAVEGLQVHGDVEGQAVEAAAAAHADAERGDLGAVDVDAGRAVAAATLDVPLGQGVDHRLLDAADVVAHAELQPAQVQQRVGHDLAGPVVGDLAAAVNADHRDVPGGQHVLGTARLAEGEHGIVLHQPQLVGGGLGARIGEALHRPPHRLVGLPAEVADQAVAAARYSVHFTSGCSRSTACATSYCSRDSARKLTRTETNLPPLDSRVLTVSRSTARSAASSSDGMISSRPVPAGPIAVISNSPGNWKPCSGLSDLISIWIGRGASAAPTGSSTTSGTRATGA